MNLSRFLSGLGPALYRDHCRSVTSSFSRATAGPAPSVYHHRRLSNKPPKIDKSRLPELREEDLEEKFIRGWGPGGQSINKTSSAVYLRHTPTGLAVKCQKHRGQHQNRKEARLLLQQKWDEVLNGEDSVTAQQQRLMETKSAKRARKTQKRRQLKAEWKKSLENDTAVDTEETLSQDKDRNDVGTT